MYKIFESERELEKFMKKVKVWPQPKMENIHFIPEQLIHFTPNRRWVKKLALLSPATLLLHDFWVGQDVGHLGKIESMVVDNDKFYCMLAGSFYSVSIE